MPWYAITHSVVAAALQFVVICTCTVLLRFCTYLFDICPFHFLLFLPSPPPPSSLSLSLSLSLFFIALFGNYCK